MVIKFDHVSRVYTLILETRKDSSMDKEFEPYVQIVCKNFQPKMTAINSLKPLKMSQVSHTILVF